MRVLADLSGNTDAADVLLIIAVVLAGLQAVLAVLGRQLEEALMPAAVALIALGLALL